MSWVDSHSTFNSPLTFQCKTPQCYPFNQNASMEDNHTRLFHSSCVVAPLMMKLSLKFLNENEKHQHNTQIMTGEISITIFNKLFFSRVIVITATHSPSECSFSLSTSFSSGPSLKHLTPTHSLSLCSFSTSNPNLVTSVSTKSFSLTPTPYPVLSLSHLKFSLMRLPRVNRISNHANRYGY
ncbi:hypothetical protein VNO78_18312 [Psophocarpus tetragonolobus]|uniref:Uncharacterized protein n=1 Tax=Psophocarpus tetragonolobus TaxID=3891 RepID=A0AAN9SJ39_PSOTE